MDRGAVEALEFGTEKGADVELKSDGHITGSAVPKNDLEVESKVQ